MWHLLLLHVAVQDQAVYISGGSSSNTPIMPVFGTSFIFRNPIMIIYEKVWNEKWDNWLDDEATWRFVNAIGSGSAFINTM
ncbi:hypothetical protein BK123_27675 [Paenibacillus lautus]|uniref:Uncharacterized protein n=1 Tax=Paenibacillus lautus TaxID=1401 RepID=A0A1R1AUS5_PAELA|nr:hypothetical protein BK123_27675 [Paenibacillus lautus]